MMRWTSGLAEDVSGDVEMQSWEKTTLGFCHAEDHKEGLMEGGPTPLPAALELECALVGEVGACEEVWWDADPGVHRVGLQEG